MFQLLDNNVNHQNIIDLCLQENLWEINLTQSRLAYPELIPLYM